jgi:hypothetical protein
VDRALPVEEALRPAEAEDALVPDVRVDVQTATAVEPEADETVTEAGIVRWRPFAAFTLTSSSNFLGCSTDTPSAADVLLQGPRLPVALGDDEFDGLEPPLRVVAIAARRREVAGHAETYPPQRPA